MRALLTMISLGAACLTPQVRAEDIRLASPDGAIGFTLSTGADGITTYRIDRRDEAVIAPSPLGFVFNDRPSPKALTVRAVGRSRADRMLPVVAGKTARARDRYNELEARLVDPAGGIAPIALIVRAYDDGIAFRYRIDGDAKPIEIVNERTGFYLPAGDRCWGLDLGSTTTAHEGEFLPFDPAGARNYRLYDTGMLCRTAAGTTHFAFAEADLRDYAGLGYKGTFSGRPGFEAALTPQPGTGKVAVRAAAGVAVTTPWRVILMADRAGDLIASDTIGNLNPQPSGDFGWVKPGLALWDWWSGPYFPGQPRRPTDTRDVMRFIDFAGQAGLPYMLIDEGWSKNYGIPGGPPVDITTPRADIDLPALLRHAKARGVGLMLWVPWNELDRRMDEALDLYASWGIRGIKVDFMNRNDQDVVAFYHRVLAAAARRHLLVDLHGAYAPTGLSRTFPNFVTQEGVMGAEFNKVTDRVTATHNVNLAFTRMLLGPMDYTPGGFRNRSPQDFRITYSPPQVKTTRGQALAMYVVYESPLGMVSDSPDAYAGAPEFDFIRTVPTVWDETRFLDGDVDSHVVVARRKGDDWYIGALNNEAARTVTLPLSFLSGGRYTGEIWQDGASFDQVRRSGGDFRKGDRLTLQLAPSGGGVATLRLRKGR